MASQDRVRRGSRGGGTSISRAADGPSTSRTAPRDARAGAGEWRRSPSSFPPRAVEVFEEARALRDGLRLLLDLVHPEQYSPAEARRTFQYPRRPPPPGPRALVFPGRTPREPIPEHAFRYLLRTMGVAERPGALCEAGALLAAL